MVIVVQAVPMFPENLQAVLVDVFESDSSPYQRVGRQCSLLEYVHTGRTSGDLSPFLQTVQFASPIGFGLALHVVVIVGLASRADEV